MEDRSALFNQLKSFRQGKLKKVETKVVTASGEQLVEKRGAKGLQVLSGPGVDGAKDQEAEPPRKLDLQVGLVVPGVLIGSQDVAHDKSSLDSYGVTHILNLDSDIENKFEDDFNYKNINIRDRPDFDLSEVFEDCFDFIDDGKHYGNVLIHCSGTIGLSRSTAICIAYLMDKEKQSFNDAFNNVKEARSFVKPNDGFLKQLKDYEVKLRGAQQAKESGIDDPFALRKKQEIEQEKAMVAGAASVKNRMKMFGANLDAGSNTTTTRSKSASPSPLKSSSGNQAASKWGSTTNNNTASDYGNKSISKSMTPEPRKSWQSKQATEAAPQAPNKASSTGPPPPPPPMPATPLGDTTSNRSSALPPPPPPPLPSGDPLKGNLSAAGTRPSSTSSSTSATRQPAPPTSHRNDLTRRQSTESQPDSDNSSSSNKQRMVFGRVPPPPMKLKGGLSIERHDSVGEKNMGFTKTGTGDKSRTSLQLPLKKQLTTDSGSESEPAAENPRAPSPSAALRAAKQQAAAKHGDNEQQQQHNKPTGQLNRSSTKKLLNLIKTKTKSDLTLPDGDENDEIEALLGALENESIENIDWDELGLDEDEVKDIIEKGAGLSSSSSSDDSEEEEEEEEEVEVETQHFVIRTK